MSRETQQVAASTRPPLARQFSILLLNKVGALSRLARTLAEDNIHICGISVVDTADAAMVRIIVDDPDACRTTLNRHRFPHTETPIVVVELPSDSGLDGILKPLVQAEVNLQYTYSLLIRPRQKAWLALYCESPEYVRDVLDRAGLQVIGQRDISR